MQIDELRDLRYFVEVARNGSFNVAALRLGVSPGAVSKAVSRLEQAMELQLFVRGRRTVRLSSDGERLLASADASFAALERSLDEVRGARQAVAGMVYLSTFTLFGRTRLAPILPRFLAEYPGVDLTISFHDLHKGLSRDSFDIRITWGEKLDDDKVAHLLCELSLVMVASPEYLRMRGVPQDPQELENHDCLAGLAPGGARARWFFTPSGGGAATVILPRGRIAVMDEMGSVTDLARAGLGLTLIDAAEAGPLIRAGVLTQVLADYRITTNDPLASQAIMQYRPRPKLSAAARALVDYLIANVRPPEQPSDASTVTDS